VLQKIMTKQNKHTNDEIAELPYLALTLDKKKQICLEAATILTDHIHSELDALTIVHLAQTAYDPEELKKLKIDYGTCVKRLFGYARDIRAEELGVTSRTMQNWINRHGIGILRLNDEGDERLFQCLGMRQRNKKSVKIWMQEYRKRRKMY
jgi:hypothetical protein